MNYMIFQRKNNKLIHVQKTYLYYYNSEAAKPFISSKSCTLLPNKNSILLFPISIFTFIFQNPKNSSIKVGSVGFEPYW